MDTAPPFVDPPYVILDDVGEYLEAVQVAERSAELNMSRPDLDMETSSVTDAAKKTPSEGESMEDAASRAVEADQDMMDTSGGDNGKASEDAGSQGGSSSLASADRKGAQPGDAPQSPDADAAAQAKRVKGSGARELKSLLSDSKKSRELRALFQDKKKWVDMEAEDGQKLLTRQLEEVLNGLKAYGEHSSPFLQRVKKSEAPGYYDVIKNPMDLGTMTKKLAKGAYTSKQEFTDDVLLIFSNCRLYNTDPIAGRVYIKHADAMERKAKELLRNVQNIDTKRLREREKERGELASPTSSSAELTKPKGKGRKRDREKDEEEEDEDSKDREGVKSRDEGSRVSSPPQAPAGAGGKKEEEEEEEGGEEPPHKKHKEESEDAEEAEEEPVPGGAPSPVEGKGVVSREDLTQFWVYRHGQRSMPFSRRTAFVREPQAMFDFVQHVSNAVTADEGADTHAHPPKRGAKGKQEKEESNTGSASNASEAGFYPEYTHYMACVPLPLTRPLAQAPASKHQAQRGATPTQTAPTSAAAAGGGGGGGGGEEVSELLSAEEAQLRFLHAVAQLAQKAGFEGVESHALEVLQEVALTYTTNVAQSLLNASQRPPGVTLPRQRTYEDFTRANGKPARTAFKLSRQAEVNSVLEKLRSYILLTPTAPSALAAAAAGGSNGVATGGVAPTSSSSPSLSSSSSSSSATPSVAAVSAAAAPISSGSPALSSSFAPSSAPATPASMASVASTPAQTPATPTSASVSAT